jgi:hypothetical protein
MPGILPDTKEEWRACLARIEAEKSAAETEAERQAETLAGIRDANMRLLHRELLEVTANEEYSEATICQYRREWARFKAYADETGLPSLPAHPDLVTAFLVERALEGTSALTRIIGAIGSKHRNEARANPYISDPTKDPMVKALLLKVKRALAEQRAMNGNGHDHEAEPQSSEARH